VNENIGLTTVHSIFHHEHNRLADQAMDTVLAQHDLAFLNEWLLSPIAALPATQAQIDALQWNGERLFQVAKFGTEMQYQHLVFEEFARGVQPMIDPFFAPTQVYDVDLNWRSSRSSRTLSIVGLMLTETVDRFDQRRGRLECNLARQSADGPDRRLPEPARLRHQRPDAVAGVRRHRPRPDPHSRQRTR
jgi:hypothetical protein